VQNHPDVLDAPHDTTSLNLSSRLHALPPLPVDREEDPFTARLVSQATEVLDPASLLVVSRGRSEPGVARVREARGLAQLFDSLSDPLGVLRGVTAQGFEVLDVLAQSVPFGRHDSQPSTLRSLRGLRRNGLSWFADVETLLGHAPHAYLTLGLIARRGPAADATNEHVERVLKQTLADYQTFGPAILPRGGFVSILRSPHRIAV
jgi:hypothetical protein